MRKGLSLQVERNGLFRRSREGTEVSQQLKVGNPERWDIDTPYLYTLLTEVVQEGKQVDRYETPVGIRSFSFDAEKGFILNGRPMKINGVCMHHDLGCLGAAVNVRAMERQAGNPERDGMQRHPVFAQSSCARIARLVRPDGVRRHG